MSTYALLHYLRGQAFRTRKDGHAYAWAGGPMLPHAVKARNRAAMMKRHEALKTAIAQLETEQR